MSKKNLIENNLKEYVIRKRAVIESLSGKRFTIKEVINEVAIYCGLKYDAINMIYKKTNNPSLYTALKIAEYFDENVEELFRLSKGKG